MDPSTDMASDVTFFNFLQTITNLGTAEKNDYDYPILGFYAEYDFYTTYTIGEVHLVLLVCSGIAFRYSERHTHTPILHSQLGTNQNRF